MSKIVGTAFLIGQGRPSVLEAGFCASQPDLPDCPSARQFLTLDFMHPLLGLIIELLMVDYWVEFFCLMGEHIDSPLPCGPVGQWIDDGRLAEDAIRALARLGFWRPGGKSG